MERKNNTLIFLVSVFITSLIGANILATKLFILGPIMAPAGVIAYPITFLCTDIISELWGKDTAQKVVWAGFIASILFMFLAYLAVILTPAPFYPHQKVFAEIFGKLGRITVAGLSAYVISQSHDVWVFHFLKTLTKDRHLWLRNNVSTIGSQFLDTIIFITIAFAGVMPLKALVVMMTSQWLIKVAIALLDTPFCYLGVGIVSRRLSMEEQPGQV